MITEEQKEERKQLLRTLEGHILDYLITNMGNHATFEDVDGEIAALHKQITELLHPSRYWKAIALPRK